MKKKFFKSTLAVVLFAAAAFGGARTYSTYTATTESAQLLSENVEAQAGYWEWLMSHDYVCQPYKCIFYWQTIPVRVKSGTGDVAWAIMCPTC